MNYRDPERENQNNLRNEFRGSPFEHGTVWFVTNHSWVANVEDTSDNPKAYPVFKVVRDLGNGKRPKERNLFLSSFLKPKYDFETGKRVSVPAGKGRLTLEFASLYDAAASDREFFELVAERYGKEFKIVIDRSTKYMQAKWDCDNNRWSRTESYPSSLLLFDLVDDKDNKKKS